MTRYVQMLWTLSIISLWPCDLFKLPVDFINMQLGHMVTHLDNGQHLHSSYMYTVIWLVNNDLSEVSVQIHSVTGIIESEPSENSYNRNVWEKIKTLGFWFSYQNTPYETLISPNLNCDLVTSFQSLNLNLNSAVFKYVALLYKGKVVIANQFLYQNTPYGTLMSPNLNCGLATQLSLINLNLKSAISKYVAFQLKGKTKPISISKHTLMEPHLTQHELWPCDPIIIFKSQFKVCHFQICYIAAKSKRDNYKPISILQHTLWDPCVTQFEMQLFDPIITFKCWFKVCHIFHYIVIQGKVI